MQHRKTDREKRQHPQRVQLAGARDPQREQEQHSHHGGEVERAQGQRDTCVHGRGGYARRAGELPPPEHRPEATRHVLPDLAREVVGDRRLSLEPRAQQLHRHAPRPCHQQHRNCRADDSEEEPHRSSVRDLGPQRVPLTGDHAYDEHRPRHGDHGTNRRRDTRAPRANRARFRATSPGTHRLSVARRVRASSLHARRPRRRSGVSRRSRAPATPWCTRPRGRARCR